MMKKTVLFLSLLLLVTLGSCSKKDEPKKGFDQLTISIHPSGHGLPSYVASQLGFYEEEKLDIKTLVYIGAPPQMEAYQAGAWEIGTTGFGGIVLGVAKKDLKIIGSTIDDGTVMGLWARADSDIAKAGYNAATGCYGTADMWKRKEILLTQGTITDILLTSTLEKLGLSNSDVVKTNMDSSPAFTAFRAGSGDLVQANSSFYFNALAEGWIPVTTGLTQELFMPSVMVASEKLLNERPDVAQRWVNAYMKGVAWIKSNPDKAADMFVDFCEDNGVATEKDKALQFVNMQIVHIPDVSQQLDLFKKSGNENLTNWQSSLANIMDYYIKMGNYTSSDRDQLLLDSKYNSKFMENLKE